MDVGCPLTSFLTLACGVKLYAAALDPIPFNYEKVYIIQFVVGWEHMMVASQVLYTQFLKPLDLLLFCKRVECADN